MTHSDKERKRLSEIVKKLRSETRLNQTEFAALVDVKQGVISTWEQGAAVPSGKNYFRLGSIARDAQDRKWLWEHAGIDAEALDKFIDERIRSKTAEASQFVEIAGLDPKDQAIPFPSRLLNSPASTKYLRIAGEEYPFKDGDMILFDPTEADLAEIEEGALVAVAAHGRHYIGPLEKPTHVGLGKPALGQMWFILAKAATGRDLIVGNRTGEGPVQTEYTVLGRVVAWIHQGSHGRQPSDSYLVHRAAAKKPRKE
jgi:hypothetical protein